MAHQALADGEAVVPESEAKLLRSHAAREVVGEPRVNHTRTYRAMHAAKLLAILSTAA